MRGKISFTAAPRAIAFVAAAAMLAASVPQASASKKEVRAAIVGGIVGVAVGAALSRKQQHNPRIYYNGYQRYYPENGYNAYFDRSFSPSPDVVCYTAQRVCYNDNGSVANKWSRRIFGF